MHVTLKTCALCTLIVNSYSEPANKTLTDNKKQGHRVCRVCKLLYPIYMYSIVSLLISSFLRLSFLTGRAAACFGRWSSWRGPPCHYLPSLHKDRVGDTRCCLYIAFETGRPIATAFFLRSNSTSFASPWTSSFWNYNLSASTVTSSMYWSACLTSSCLLVIFLSSWSSFSFSMIHLLLKYLLSFGASVGLLFPFSQSIGLENALYLDGRCRWLTFPARSSVT